MRKKSEYVKKKDEAREQLERYEKSGKYDRLYAIIVDLEKIDQKHEKEILKLFYRLRNKEIKGENTTNEKNELNEIFLEIFRR